LAVESISTDQKGNDMAKKKEFNLSLTIRDFRRAHKGMKATEALAAVKKAHPDQKINDGTFKATFYKLAGGGTKRKVRRLKPGASGNGHMHLAMALTFVRNVGSVAAAKEQLEAVAKLIEVAKDVG
jgi:hypothetical protein